MERRDLEKRKNMMKKEERDSCESRGNCLAKDREKMETSSFHLANFNVTALLCGKRTRRVKRKRDMLNIIKDRSNVFRRDRIFWRFRGRERVKLCGS